MTAAEPGGARVPADPERLAEAEAHLRAIADRPAEVRARTFLLPPDVSAIRAVLAEIERLKAWVTDRDERIACLEDERDEARAEVAQRGEIMREQGAELRDAERAAYDGWCADRDGAR